MDMTGCYGDRTKPMNKQEMIEEKIWDLVSIIQE
jgi:hypothetical protein